MTQAFSFVPKIKIKTIRTFIGTRFLASPLSMNTREIGSIDTVLSLIQGFTNVVTVLSRVTYPNLSDLIVIHGMHRNASL